MDTKHAGSTTVTIEREGLWLQVDRASPRLTALGWDTEGTGRQHINLLASPAELRLSKGGSRLSPETHFDAPTRWTARYDLSFGRDAAATFAVVAHPDTPGMRLTWSGDTEGAADRAELVIPFEPRTAVTCVIADTWTDDGRFHLPAIVSAPDLGQMLVTCAERPDLAGRIEGSRKEHWVTVTFDLPPGRQDSPLELVLSPVVLPLPAGYADARRWSAARRGWFNLIQLSCGASGGNTPVLGVWANNVLSDPVSSVLYMLADAALLVPELAPGVTMAPLLRRAVDYWIDHKTDKDGLVAYTAGGVDQNVMDGNPAVLIAAWAYVELSGDTAWLGRRIGSLERLSRYLEGRDVDGDGLVESKQSGDHGSQPPRDPDCAWDCYMSGHKNAYINTLTFRAWQGLAALESRLGRREEARRLTGLAQRLKSVFLETFYNPETGWLGFWRSRDGMLHDLAMDAPTSFAVDYGLVDPTKGREMLERYWSALERSGFSRFDLGTPLGFRPVPREEMCHYTEFQQFLNAGCAVSNTSYLLNAMYAVGMTEKADKVLDAMLERQRRGVYPNGGGFQNGFVDHMGAGAEVFDWGGNPAGYEGHLVYCWAFLHSLLLRESDVRRRCREEPALH
jgi:hypothetical protein